MDFIWQCSTDNLLEMPFKHFDWYLLSSNNIEVLVWFQTIFSFELCSVSFVFLLINLKVFQLFCWSCHFAIFVPLHYLLNWLEIESVSRLQALFTLNNERFFCYNVVFFYAIFKKIEKFYTTAYFFFFKNRMFVNSSWVGWFLMVG